MLTPVILAPLSSPRLTRSRFQYSQHRAIDDCWEAQAASASVRQPAEHNFDRQAACAARNNVFSIWRLELSSFVVRTALLLAIPLIP
jgi:hypothetical protein